MVTALCRPLRLTPPQKAVVMCLADYCHDDGKDWHSVAAIMAWTCAGKSTVLESLDALEVRGLIAIQKTPGRNNRTFLQLDKIRAEVDAAQAADQSATRTSPGGEPVRQPDHHQSATRTTPVRQPDHTSPPAGPEALESIREASVKHQGVQADAFPDAAPANAGPQPEGSARPFAKWSKKEKAEPKTGPAWQAYSEAYVARHGTEPLRDRKANALMAQVVSRLGADAPAVARFYVGHPRDYYAQRTHDLTLLVQDAASLHTQWKTGRHAQQLPTRGQRAPSHSGFESKNYGEGMTDGTL